MAKNLIHRKKLVIDPELHLVAPPSDGTDHWTPPPADHPVYSAVGRISAKWARIEDILDLCIGALADIQGPVTSCITAQMMGHTPRCLTIKALAHWRELPEIEKDVERLRNELHEVSELRNRAIHDIFVVQKSDGALAINHKMSKKELLYGIKTINVSDLETIIKQIDARIIKCAALHRKINDQAIVYFP